MPKYKAPFLYVSPKLPREHRLQLLAHLSTAVFIPFRSAALGREEFFPADTKSGWVVDKAFLFSLS